MPGDLSQFAVPMGTHSGGESTMKSWDDFSTMEQRARYYTGRARMSHPFAGAPRREAAGGAIYFDGRCKLDDVQAATRLLSIEGRQRDYVAFYEESSRPAQDNYLTQLRLVTGFALRFYFHAKVEVPEQEYSIGEVICRYIQHYQDRHGVGMSRSLAGVMGGDGDVAREALAFGLMTETSYYGVFRVWTRPWLVSK